MQMQQVLKFNHKLVIAGHDFRYYCNLSSELKKNNLWRGIGTLGGLPPLHDSTRANCCGCHWWRYLIHHKFYASWSITTCQRNQWNNRIPLKFHDTTIPKNHCKYYYNIIFKTITMVDQKKSFKHIIIKIICIISNLIIIYKK